jgi:hypothetical protein
MKTLERHRLRSVLNLFLRLNQHGLFGPATTD